jgi:hypothetical protein
MDAPKGNIGSANPVFIFLLEHPFFFDQYFYELFRLGTDSDFQSLSSENEYLNG